MAKKTQEQRIRERLFPLVKTYNRKAGKFTALPIILRRCQGLFGSPRHWQIYTWVCMRAGAAGIAWFSLAELGSDIAFGNRSKLRPYLTNLIAMGWLQHKVARGTEYYIAPDPLEVLRKLDDRSKIPKDIREGIDVLLESLKLETLEQRRRRLNGEADEDEADDQENEDAKAEEADEEVPAKKSKVRATNRT